MYVKMRNSIKVTPVPSTRFGHPRLALLLRVCFHARFARSFLLMGPTYPLINIFIFLAVYLLLTIKHLQL